MNAEIKEKWILALTSGKYQQGQQALLRNGQYCCLGVLCDIVEPDGWNKSGTVGIIRHDGKADMPANRILKMVGIDGSTSTTLAGLNDVGQNFNEIAEYIQENL